MFLDGSSFCMHPVATEAACVEITLMQQHVSDTLYGGSTHHIQGNVGFENVLDFAVDSSCLLPSNTVNGLGK